MKPFLSKYNSRNLDHLRVDSSELDMLELREIAKKISDLINPNFPISWKHLVKENSKDVDNNE